MWQHQDPRSLVTNGKLTNPRFETHGKVDACVTCWKICIAQFPRQAVEAVLDRRRFVLIVLSVHQGVVTYFSDIHSKRHFFYYVALNNFKNISILGSQRYVFKKNLFVFFAHFILEHVSSLFIYNICLYLMLNVRIFCE